MLESSQTFDQERLTAWLVSVKLSFNKRGSKVTGGWNTEKMIRMLNLGSDVTKSFEYLLATGNLHSKTGTDPQEPDPSACCSFKCSLLNKPWFP